MSDHASSVITPEQAASSPASPPVKSGPAQGKEFLFDSIARESIDTLDENSASSWSAFFTGLLWVGYAIAIAVALVLVWSAARELLR